MFNVGRSSLGLGLAIVVLISACRSGVAPEQPGAEAGAGEARSPSREAEEPEVQEPEELSERGGGGASSEQDAEESDKGSPSRGEVEALVRHRLQDPVTFSVNSVVLAPEGLEALERVISGFPKLADSVRRNGGTLFFWVVCSKMSGEKLREARRLTIVEFLIEHGLEWEMFFDTPRAPYQEESTKFVEEHLSAEACVVVASSERAAGPN